MPYKGAPTGEEMEAIVNEYEVKHGLLRGHLDYRYHPWDAPDDKIIVSTSD